MQKETLIQQIKQNWHAVLHPKPTSSNQKLGELVKADFVGHSVFAQDDGFNYGKCYSYELFVKPGNFGRVGNRQEEAALIQKLGGHKDTLVLEFSVVLPYYLLKAYRRTVGSNGDFVDQEMSFASDFVSLSQKAQHLAEKQGFTRLTDEYLSTLVPGVELEEAEPGTVSVYNCLFWDVPNYARLIQVAK